MKKGTVEKQISFIWAKDGELQERGKDRAARKGPVKRTSYVDGDDQRNRWVGYWSHRAIGWEELKSSQWFWNQR